MQTTNTEKGNRCTCTNELQYSNCASRCERYYAELNDDKPMEPLTNKPTDQPNAISEIKIVLYKILQLSNENLPADTIERIIHKDAHILVDMVYHWNKSLTENRSELVEKCVEAVMFEITYPSDLLREDIAKQIRIGLTQVLNPEKK